jgi:hypothetical protein
VVLGNSKTHSVRETLSQRASRNFNAVGVVRLGVTRCDAIYCLKDGLDFASIKQKNGLEKILTLNALISSKESLYPQRWRRAYCSMQAWPLLSVALVEQFQGKLIKEQIIFKPHAREGRKLD